MASREDATLLQGDIECLDDGWQESMSVTRRSWVGRGMFSGRVVGVAAVAALVFLGFVSRDRASQAGPSDVSLQHRTILDLHEEKEQHEKEDRQEAAAKTSAENSKDSSEEKSEVKEKSAEPSEEDSEVTEKPAKKSKDSSEGKPDVKEKSAENIDPSEEESEVTEKPAGNSKDSSEDKSEVKSKNKSAHAKKPKEDKYAKCAAVGQSCAELSCCKDAGMQCYSKSEYWSECMIECEPGRHLTDPDSTEWTCDTVGERTPGEPKTCSKEGEDCHETQCCEEAGTQCFAKNEFWATCRPMCEPGPDLMAPDKDPWSCKELGPRKPGAGAWVLEECAGPDEDCSEAQCCSEGGHQCFKKDDWFSTCKDWCEPGWKEHEWDSEWSCEAVGPVTPRSNDPGPHPVGQVAPWVEDTCVGEGENCIESMCCRAVGWQCYKKNEYWGQCHWECPPPDVRRRLGDAEPAEDAKATGNASKPVEDDTWDCSPIGPRSWGLALRGYPSLYCVTLYMPSSYEGDIMNKQLAMDAGIFQCDGFELVASEEVTLGSTSTGHLAKTKKIEKVEVGVSQDGTAGNAKLFMAFWDAIIAGKRFRDFDWTIKADPDAVLIPWRIRDHMRPHLGANAYVVNCNKFPSSPNFPMMYGSVEIFSSAAMIAYADGSWQCGKDLPWKEWGEDYYMTHCLDYLGVGRISDFSVVGDNVCTGANCAGGDASFHPFKTPDDWAGCWIQAVPPPAPAEPAEEPAAEPAADSES